MDLENLKKTLEDAKTFFQPEVEATVFSIGGRGYYENPISDILAFFLNPQEAHGFGTLFLDAFWTALNVVSPPQSIDIIGSPKREVSTESGKRIDLLLEGDEWVLVIENKIYHHQSNPFKEYEQYIKNNYEGKEAIFSILSPSGSSASKEWKPLSYKKFVEELKRNIGNILIDAQYSKWLVFLRDFILNLEQYAVRYDMDLKAINFIEDNYQDVYEVVRLRESYISYLQETGLEKLKTLFPDQNFTTTIHNWKHGPAIRYYSESWVGKSNIVIQVSHRESDKGIGIYMYAYNISETYRTYTDEKLQKEHKAWTESKTIRCYASNNRYSHLNDIISEFEETAKDFNDFNTNREI